MSNSKQMQKKIHAKAKADKKKEQSRGNLFSLLGGVVFFSVVIALAINRDARIRAEIDAQIKGFLTTTKRVLVNYQHIVHRIERATTDIKNVTKSSTIEEQNPLLSTDPYDQMWEPAEQALHKHPA
jgi:hypothetical protein